MATKTQNILIKSNNTDKTKVPASLQHKELAANLLDRSLFGCNGTSVFKYYTGEDKYFNTEGKANISVYAESAEKLKTSRSIFGQPFDGLSDCNGDMNVTGKATIAGDVICGGEVVAVAGEGTPAGVTDYSALTGKPSINGVTLVSGNNTLAALGIQAAGDYATNSGVTTLLADYATKTFVANNYAGKAAFNSHTADTNIHITSAERVAWNAKWDYNEATIKAVKVTSASSADSVAWANITNKPSTFTPSAHTHTASDVSGLPTSLKNPYALTFGSKTYDGSAAKTITASDLGALTAHQSIYAFTLQVNGTSKGTYNPTSAAKTINIAVPTKTSDITNDSGFITSASIPTALKNPYAVEIKANGISLGTYDGSKAATFNLSAANVGAANKIHTHTASEVSGLPTKLSSFTNDVGYITGITKSMVEGVLTGDISSHSHSYLPLSGGTITGDILSSNMNVGIRWNVDYLDGWSRNFLEFNAHKDNDATKALESVFKIGGYGGSTGYIFTYIGANSYDSAYNIRFYSNNAITIGTYEILHANNYNSYTPTLTGTGARGTWGISISGNAATATNATNADTLDSLHSSDFARSRDDDLLPTDINHLGYGYVHNGWGHYGPAFTFGTSAYCARIQKDAFSNRLYVSSWIDNSTNTDWGAIAFLTDNVASATKLQTSEGVICATTDGSGNVTFSKEIFIPTDRAVRMADSSGVYQNAMFVLGSTLNVGYDSPSINIGGKIYINSSGNVLIGTTTDNGYKLQVAGSERVYGDLIVDGEVSALVA